MYYLVFILQMTPELTSLAHHMCKYQLAWEPERYLTENLKFSAIKTE